MQEKLLKKIIPDFAGPNSEKLVDILHNKQNVNEFLIAKKLDLTINQTRNMLYKLADEGLVSFIRKKDKKKGGWYTYFWTLKAKKALTRFREDIKEKIDKLQKELEHRETARQYYCKNCDIEYKEEDAMEHDFTCIECGEVLEIRETKELSAHLKNEIARFKETLVQLDQEITYIVAKEEKAKERKIKAEKKQKDLERKKRREERAKEKAKLLKKEGKVQKPKKKKIKKKPKSKKKVKKKSKKKSPTKKKVKKKSKKKSPAKKKPKKFSKKRKKR